jgi:multiple sugar transport system substrate-binding protein
MTSPRRRRTKVPKVRSALAGALALGLLASGCGGGSDADSGGKTVVRFANWAEAEDATRAGIQALIKKFEETHPTIDVRSEPVSFTDIEHQLLRQVQSGNAPDVAELSGNYTFTIGETKTLQPLGEFADAAFKQAIIPAELKLGEVGGQLVAVPWTVGPVGLWYNKKVMKDAGLDPDKPPATWDELRTALAAVQKKDSKLIPLGLDTTNRPYGLDVNWPIMRSFGGQPFQGATATANTPGMKAYFTFMRELATKKFTPVNQKGGFFRQPAASDQVAFTIDGPYVKNVVQSVNKVSDEKFYDTWGVAPLPTAVGQHFSVPTDHQLVMFKTSEKKQAAWEFMKFLATSPDGVQYTVKDEGCLPAVNEATGAAAEHLDNPIAEAFREDVIPTVARPDWGARYAKAYSPVMAAVQSAMTSQQPVDAIATSLQSRLQSGLG